MNAPERLDIYSRQAAHRGLFVTAAWFNWLAGLPLLVATGPVAPLMGLQLNAAATMFIQLTAGIVVVFGGVYWLIARDPVRYRVYIPLGILLKAYFVVVIYGWWLSGSLAWPLAALVSGDVVFAVLFWRYYRRSVD